MVIRDRKKWNAKVEARLDAVYGVKPYGPGIPERLDDAFAAGWSPVKTVAHLGKAFNLTVLESWKLAKAAGQ